jgi:hypothetical protein
MRADGTYQRIADKYSRMKVEPIANELRLRFAEPVWEW